MSVRSLTLLSLLASLQFACGKQPSPNKHVAPPSPLQAPYKGPCKVKNSRFTINWIPADEFDKTRYAYTGFNVKYGSQAGNWPNSVIVAPDSSRANRRTIRIWNPANIEKAKPFS